MGLTQEIMSDYGQKTRQGLGVLWRRFILAFTAHPAQTRESYLEHLWFTIKTSLRFMAVGFVLLTHGIFPFLFTRTASRQIEKIYLLMRSRIPSPRREHIENEYEI